MVYFIVWRMMPEVGESSRVVEDEPRDIHVVWEAPIVEPVPEQPDTVEAEEEEEPETDPEEDLETEEENEVEEEPPVERSLMSQMADVIDEMEDQLDALQSENHSLNNTKEQYESLVHTLVTRNAELSEERNQLLHGTVDLTNKKRELEEENEALKAEFDVEIADKIRVEESWEKSCRLVDRLEREVRNKKARMNMMSYAFTTTFDRLKVKFR